MIRINIPIKLLKIIGMEQINPKILIPKIIKLLGGYTSQEYANQLEAIPDETFNIGDVVYYLSIGSIRKDTVSLVDADDLDGIYYMLKQNVARRIVFNEE